ncbi:hypothetical protein [Demequina sp.]|uniref:hypothetical protein n=1 Tax=Demequina sp. TaxID=2050685 RepID=UPI003A837F1B
MSEGIGWTAVEATHRARVRATREEVLAAELDIEWNCSVVNQGLSDLVIDDRGLPVTWTAVARAGLLRQQFHCALLASDPVVISSVHGERMVQTSTTKVDAEPGADGRIGVVWAVDAQITARNSWARAMLARSTNRLTTDLQKHLDRTMTAWVAAIEARSVLASQNAADSV